MKLWAATAREMGREIRARRHSLGWSQEELAWQAGLHRTYVADVELGKRNLSLGSQVQLAAGLGCEVRDLFPSATPPAQRSARSARTGRLSRPQA